MQPQRRRGVPDHAGHHPLHGGRHRLRRARGEHAASRRRRPPQGPLRTRGNERTMKVIIPLAGKGTRLRPHTHLVPKPMLKIAGKPVMAYILEDLEQARQRRAGHLRHRPPEGEGRGVRANGVPDLPAVFVEQKVQDGTAGAVKLAQPYVDQDVLIIFVDTIFETDLSRDQEHRRRRHHLGEGGRGLPALRRGRHRQGRQHDEDRREADRRRSPSARTSASTTSRTGSCSSRGSTTCSRSRRTRASTISPTPSST